mmetsp:Transcript_9029/g.20380  ORF Transcript_9029/g.20380 Transcript_9029/m.20380 type:complete len:420 (-) Transcript_9029:106-1365(-)
MRFVLTSHLLLWASFLALPSSSFQSPTTQQTLCTGHANRARVFAATRDAESSSSSLGTVDMEGVDTATEPDLPFFATWPKWLQNFIRDSGGVKLLVDVATRTLAAPVFYYDNPWCFPEFVRISGNEYPWLVSLMRVIGAIDRDKPNIHFSKEAYGEHAKQIAQVMVPKGVDESRAAAPLFIFLHGGAWGSGFPTMYRLLSLPFLERDFRAVILGYRTYPEASVDGQIDDLCLAVNHFVERYGGVGGSGGPVVLMGHSSGAHISMMAALQGRLPAVDAFISASGVYDIEEQFEREKQWCVQEISPMSAANGFTAENLQKNSPSRLAGSLPLDFPPVLLLHGAIDEVLPPRNSEDFYDVLLKSSLTSGRLGLMPRRRTKRVDVKVVDGVGHQEIVLDTCLGGKTKSIIVDWLAQIDRKNMN